MTEHYKKKFGEKTDQELILIIENTRIYKPEAVAAATELLNSRKKMGIEVVSKPAEILPENELKFTSFIPRPFLRTLSFRDFFTSFSLALLWLAIQEVSNLYDGEYYFNGISDWIIGLSFLFIPLINHCIYRLEHKRSNNYIGRLIHSSLIIIFFIIIKTIFDILVTLKLELYIMKEDILGLWPLFIVLIFLEIFFGLLRRLFNLLKWRIL